MNNCVSTMKVFRCVSLTLFVVHATHAFNPETLDLVLRSIEYLISVKPGVFSCVFYDAAPDYPRDNILNAVQRSPRLDETIIYVLTGCNRRSALDDMPWNPSLLIVHAGSNSSHLKLADTRWDLIYVLCSFDPSVKVMVLANDVESLVLDDMMHLIHQITYTYFVLISDSEDSIWQCNAVYLYERPKEQHPMYLFTWQRRWLKDRDIKYIRPYGIPNLWNIRWLKETARYLNTKAIEYKSSCSESHEEYLKCDDDFRKQIGDTDVNLQTNIISPDIPMGFMFLFTSQMVTSKMLVPRDRSLNTAELLVMPFNWQAWALIGTVLVSAEIIKHLFPDLFRNDPFLLAVFGFERHDLHRAGRWEQIVSLSLIILMFFVSSAFETKIISLMVSKPSIQRIQTLEDLQRSNLKMYVDLEKNPHFADLDTVGCITAQGKMLELNEMVPGAALRWRTVWVDALKDVPYDFERMQPFYVVLDGEYTDGPELYPVSYRNSLTKDFRFMHITLVEVGILELWKREWRNGVRYDYIGVRPRPDINEKETLNIDDMMIAWFILGVGLSISAVGFLGEQIWKYVGTWWQQRRICFVNKGIAFKPKPFISHQIRSEVQNTNY